jgi:NTE family protein
LDAYIKRSARLNNDIELTLAFSGGGTRAAAFSYGVLQALRDSSVRVNGRLRRLLDEVDAISSVSGGSFTAAYYGLHGERIFAEFEEAFLRRDFQTGLIYGLLNPLRWFSTTGRTEMAIEYFDENVFKGATFADMVHKDRPLIVINASDLSNGVRFSFLQEYFELLCSNLSTFPVSRAVAASSAVPVLFSPVVIQNYPDCVDEKPAWLTAAKQRSADNFELSLAVNSLESYHDKDKVKYAHFVDGGITDNLGLRALYEFVEIAGGAQSFVGLIDQKVPSRIVLIVVNASTEPEYGMSVSNAEPSLEATINAVTGVQLRRYNAATLELMEQILARWAEELSTPERPVVPYFITLGFREIEQHKKRLFFNQIPTSFSLTDVQVDRLIEAGRKALHADPEFNRLLADLEAESESP